MVGVGDQLELLKQQLPTVGSADIQRWAQLWRTPQNRVVLMTLPKAKDALVPDTAFLFAMFDKVRKASLTPYEEVENSAPLLATQPTPGKITTTRQLPNDVVEWTLSNGIRVYLHPTTNTADKVFFSGWSRGGFLHDLDKGYVPAVSAGQVVPLGGFGTFSRAELGKRLAGRSVEVATSISPYAQAVSGGAVLADLDVAFQLLYMAFTQPRADTAVVTAYRNQLLASLANNATPEQAFSDTIATTMSQHHPLARTVSAALVDSIDVTRSLAVYRDRFSDASDFRFVIVGNFSVDTMAPLVERYLASLPGNGRKEAVVDPGIHPPAGIVRKTVHGGTEPKTLTVLSFYGPMTMSRDNEWNIYALSKIIELRLTERLRLQLGGTYAVDVRANVTPDPKPHYNLTIQFVTAPERASELTAATLAVLDTLQRAPAHEDDVQKVREAELLGFASAVSSDAFWMSQINAFATYDLPFAELTSDAHIRRWRASDVQAAARRYIDLKRYAHFDLVPVVPGTR